MFFCKIGKWDAVGGLGIEIKGKEYIAMVHMTAPNDYKIGGEPQHMHLCWCPSSGVQEEQQH